MTPEICLISVPHNGTMFTREIFVAAGWHEQGLNGRPNPTPTLFQGHCEKTGQTRAAIELGQRMPIVMPLRHPYRVEESWKRRGMDLVRMQGCYRNMLDSLLRHVSAWLPIDAAPLIKKIAHDRLNAMAEKQLFIDWDTLINAEKNTHDVALTTLDPSPEIRDIRRHPLFTEFYGEAG